MATVRITIPKHHIKALVYSMATKDIRYYLCGINVQSNGIETRCSSTDGYRLAVAINRLDSEPFELVNFIIPADLVQTICKQKKLKNNNFECVIVEYNTDTKLITVIMANATFAANAVDGIYPDYTRVLDRVFQLGNQPVVAMLNSAYVHDAELSFCEFNQIAYDKLNVRFCPKGENAGIISCQDFVHVVMPLRLGGPTIFSDTVTNGLDKPLC
jgi:DNA polymerase III sliding clamp (beta) subunit (PCNA family)